MRAVNVAVVGAGPGGAAVAHSIRTVAPKLSVHVYERSPDLNRAGSLIELGTNGHAALEAMSPECLRTVESLFLPQGPHVFYNSNGQEYRRIPARPSDGSKSGGRIPWFRLQQGLTQLLPPDAVHVGCNLQSLTITDDSAVELQFRDQAPVLADIVIGCDGNQSKVRSIVLADGPPTFAHQATWRGVAPVPSDWPHMEDLGSWFGENFKSGMLTTSVLGGGLISWQAYAPWGADRLAELGDGRYIGGSTGKGTAEDRKQRCLGIDLLTNPDFPPYVVELIRSTDPQAVTEHGVFFREPEACQVWGRGPVTLLGDAAHLGTPMLAQGLNQALEDAVELGRAIGEHGPTEAALREYERVRVPRATRVQAGSVGLAKLMVTGQSVNEWQWYKENPWCQEHRPEPLVAQVVA